MLEPISLLYTVLLNVIRVFSQMIPSDSPQAKGDGSGLPAKAKRSRAEEQAGRDAVLRPGKLSRTELYQPPTVEELYKPPTVEELYKPPTVEELQQLKEAESLFHCSLLKMQVSCQQSRRCIEMQFLHFIIFCYLYAIKCLL